MADIRIESHGTILTFQPLTDEMQEWLDENVDAEGWQYLGDILCCDRRPGFALAAGIAEAGFEITTYGGGR